MSDIDMDDNNNIYEEEEEEIPFNEPEYWSLFLIDTETTGDKGVPLCHKNSQILQICILHVTSDKWFRALSNPSDDLYIPPESVQKHRIGREELTQNGKKAKEVMLEMEKWVKMKSNNKTPLMTAHNSLFDRTMVMKTWYEQLGKSFGRDCKKHNWVWLDTLEAFRDKCPELTKKYHLKEMPFSLGTLMEHYLPEINMSTAHNAETDVKALKLLFIKILLPKLPELYDPLWKVKCRYLHIHPGKYASKRLYHLTDITGLGEFRAYHINDICNKAFLAAGGEYLKCITPLGMFTITELLCYCYMRYLQHCAMLKPTAPVPCEWWSVAKEIEVMCRSKPLDIYSDNIIANLITYVLSIPLKDLVFHTMRDDGNKQFFPTLPGEPISYLPLTLNEREARKVYNELGFRTVTEMYADFKYIPSHLKKNWLNNLNARLDPGNAILFDELTEFFQSIVKYGG